MSLQNFDLSGYEDFLKPDCDRLKFIQNKLNSYGLDSVVLNIEGKNHLYVKFPEASYNAAFKIKTIVAHYDIAPKTSGANDNSSGVFALLDLAKNLSTYNSFHNVRVIFTDGEEQITGGVRSQGAYSLSEHLRKTHVTEDNVFVVDSVGRGTVAVLTQTDLPLRAPEQLKKSLNTLVERTKEILRVSCPSSWVSLPAPFSDNAGFVATGTAAVAITLLPKEEATEYANALLRIKNLAAAVSNRSVDDPKTPGYVYRENMPTTWRLFHTEFDNYLSLTKESFPVIQKILWEIAQLKIF